MSATPEAIRRISGRRSDDGDPGGLVVATVYAPEPYPRFDRAARIRCPFIHSTDMFIFGVDDEQRIQLAIRLVLDLFVHRGVRGITVSLVPPDGLIC